MRSGLGAGGIKDADPGSCVAHSRVISGKTAVFLAHTGVAPPAVVHLVAQLVPLSRCVSSAQSLGALTG